MLYLRILGLSNLPTKFSTHFNSFIASISYRDSKIYQIGLDGDPASLYFTSTNVHLHRKDSGDDKF